MSARRYINASLPVVVSGAPPVGAIQCLILEPADHAAMVGVRALITGSLNRVGVVTIKLGATVLGLATVSGLAWSYLWTPQTGDTGAGTITATAIDANNGSVSTDTLAITVAAAAVYPGTVTPLARFDGAHGAAFSDAAGTAPAVVHGLVKRVNDVSPLASNWQAPHGVLDPTGIRLEPSSLVEAYPLAYSGNVGTAIKFNDCTFIYSWVQRWGDWTLALSGAPTWSVSPTGVVTGGTPYALTGFATTVAARHTLAVRFKSDGIKARLLTNGVQTGSIDIAATLASGSPNDTILRVGHFQSFAYGTQVELNLINRAVNDTEFAQLLAYADSIPCRPAFPVDQDLYMACGDSNTVGVSSSQYATPKFAALRSLRASYNVELLCTAVTGSGVSGHGPMIAPYYDARRRRHVVSLAAGTNDIATGSTGAATLAAYLADLDAMRTALGGRGKIIACTVQDRNGLFAGGANVGTYQTQVAIFNAGVRAATSRYDYLVDIAAVPELGTPGAADSATYFAGDKVHFLDAAQDLIAPLMLAGITSCLG